MATLTKLARVLGLTRCLGDRDIINTVTGCFPTCLTAVRSLDPCLIFFFLFFLFFFFLFTELLASELSLDEKDGMKGDLASEEGEEDPTGEDGEGST